MANAGILTDPIWENAGDIAYATGQDAATVLPVGAEQSKLTVASGIPAWEGTAWTSWTPTITASGGGWAIGNGTQTGFYKMLDANTAILLAFIQWGSTTTNGTGSYDLTGLPITFGAINQVCQSLWLDNGSSYYLMTGRATASDTKIADFITTNNTTTTLWSATYPAAPANGDQMIVSGIFNATVT